MNVPPTPDESASAAPRSPRMVGPPASRAPVLSGAELDETMLPLAEAGSLPDQVGLDAPSTPTVEPAPVTPPNVSLPASTNPSSGHADAAMPTTTLGVGHERDAHDDGGNRPAKHPRIFAVHEHEDDPRTTYFEESEVDGLEVYDFSLDYERYEDANSPTHNSAASCDEMLKQLTIPFTALEPDLPAAELLRLDTIADELEIKRLRSMGVLIPAENYDFDGKVPKSLTTRMVRAWRDKFIDGVHVWLRRSRYVAREFAWLTPDRQDLFSPASSVLF